MPHSKISLTVDQDRLTIILRYLGDVSGAELKSSLMARFEKIPDFWKYDLVVDLRRHDEIVTTKENEELSRQWLARMQGQDSKSRTAIVTDDLSTRARLTSAIEAFTPQSVAFFDGIDEALQWLHPAS